MNLDQMKYALNNLLHRKMRSWLTVLSILIGIMAIYAIISFGLGMQSYINEFAEGSAARIIMILPKGVGAPGLDDTFFISPEDINYVDKIKGVESIMGMYAKVGEISFKKENKYSFILGLDPEKTDLVDNAFGFKVEKGRHLKKGDITKIVVGYNYQLDDTIFSRGLSTGEKIEINGEPFHIVGFYEEIGNPDDDSNIYMTFDGFETLYPASKDKFGYVMAQAAPTEDAEKLAEKIQDKLRRYKGQEEGKEDFYAQTYSDLLETFTVVLNVINGVLVLIAFVSLIVAFVNIMNTMYTAVIERTKEIGIMKAIGAKNSDILGVFVVESGMLGMVGGIMGVLLGWLIAKGGGAAAAAAGYSSLYPIFPWYLTTGCIAFAFFVGAFAGLLPAIQASKQKPVDALRYE